MERGGKLGSSGGLILAVCLVLAVLVRSLAVCLCDFLQAPSLGRRHTTNLEKETFSFWLLRLFCWLESSPGCPSCPGRGAVVLFAGRCAWLLETWRGTGRTRLSAGIQPARGQCVEMIDSYSCTWQGPG